MRWSFRTEVLPRLRWASVGVAVAVLAGVGGVRVVSASGGAVTPDQTLITPCRLLDTRPAPRTVGPRATPLVAGEVLAVQVVGRNGNCDIPSGTVGLVLNVTVVSPASNGYLTVYPGGATRPTASNLNFTAGQAAVPNQVTVGVGATGQIAIYASGGPVNVLADVAGFTTSSRMTTTDLSLLRWQRDRGRPGTVDAGGSPLGLATDGSLVWATNFLDGTVSRVDPATNATVGSPVAVGTFPVGLAFDGTYMWVSSAGLGELTRINATTGAVFGAPVVVGAQPSGVAVADGTVWVANQGDGTVSRIDAATGADAGPPVTVGAAPLAVAFDGQRVWVTNYDDGTVSRIDASTGVIVGGPITVGTQPCALAFDGVNMWVANQGDGTVVRIDAASGVVAGSPISVGSSPLALAFDGTRVWVADGLGDAVTRIDVATAELLTPPIPVGDQPSGLVFDGTSVWTSDFAAATLTKLRAR